MFLLYKNAQKINGSTKDSKNFKAFKKELDGILADWQLANQNAQSQQEQETPVPEHEQHQSQAETQNQGQQQNQTQDRNPGQDQNKAEKNEEQGKAAVQDPAANQGLDTFYNALDNLDLTEEQVDEIKNVVALWGNEDQEVGKNLQLENGAIQDVSGLKEDNMERFLQELGNIDSLKDDMEDIKEVLTAMVSEKEKKQEQAVDAGLAGTTHQAVINNGEGVEPSVAINRQNTEAVMEEHTTADMTAGPQPSSTSEAEGVDGEIVTTGAQESLNSAQDENAAIGKDANLGAETTQTPTEEDNVTETAKQLDKDEEPTKAIPKDQLFAATQGPQEEGPKPVVHAEQDNKENIKTGYFGNLAERAAVAPKNRWEVRKQNNKERKTAKKEYKAERKKNKQKSKNTTEATKAAITAARIEKLESQLDQLNGFDSTAQNDTKKATQDGTKLKTGKYSSVFQKATLPLANRWALFKENRALKKDRKAKLKGKIQKNMDDSKQKTEKEKKTIKAARVEKKVTLKLEKLGQTNPKLAAEARAKMAKRSSGNKKTKNIQMGV